MNPSDEQLTEAQWAEIDLHVKYTPEWTGGPDWAYWAMADRALLLGEVRASRAREAEWAQAAWDAYGTLGFDRDGDETPAAQVGWGPDSLRAFAADAREEADAGDSEEERLHLEYRRVSKEAREKLRAERDHARDEWHRHNERADQYRRKFSVLQQRVVALAAEVESLDDYICDLTMLSDSVVPPVLKDRLHRFIDRRRAVSKETKHE